jgi:hypothetical protein
MRLCLPPIKQQARLLLCQPPNPIRNQRPPSLHLLCVQSSTCICHVGAMALAASSKISMSPTPLAACACVVAPNHGGQKEQTSWPHHGGLSFSFLY